MPTLEGTHPALETAMMHPRNDDQPPTPEAPDSSRNAKRDATRRANMAYLVSHGLHWADERGAPIDVLATPEKPARDHLHRRR
jgi:hypothetical protein